MLNRLPEFIDPLHLVEKCQGFKGTISLAKMHRLALLAEAFGKAEVEIHFGRDSAGLAVATGKVKAALKLQCQRCLEPMEFTVDSEFTLGVVATLDQTRSLPENYEPLVVEQGPVSLPELVEDEILLALPVIATHPGNCPVTRSADDWRSLAGDSMYNADRPADTVPKGDSRQNPFAVLAELKGKLRK